MTQQLLQFDPPTANADFERDPAWFFEGGNRARAVEALVRYHAKFRGSWFEKIADNDEPDRITARDIVAVSMLGVDIPAGKSIWLLNDGREQVHELLLKVPAEQKLWEPNIALSPKGPLWRLWKLVRAGGWPGHTGGMGPTKTSKLLAAKRPGAVPIYDSRIASALFAGKRPENYWNVWRDRLTGARGKELRDLANDVREEAGIGESLSVLRVIDIVVWMWETDRRKGRH